MTMISQISKLSFKATEENYSLDDYEKELEKDNGAPQDIQKKYPDYTALVADLTETNNIMIAYKELMKDIAFDNKL